MIKTKRVLPSPLGNLLCLLFFAFLLLAIVRLAFASSEITGIDVREVDGSTEIVINSTSPLNYTVYKPSDPYLVVVELQDAELGKFAEKMMIDRAGVMEITPSMVEGMENVVRLEISLTVPADVKPMQKDNSLILSFVNPEVAVAVAEEKATEAPTVAEVEAPEIDREPAEAIEVKRPQELGENVPVCDSEEGYVGERISLDFQDAELVHIFRLIADVSGCNIVVSPAVKGKFSMRLKDVPWDQALDIILRNYGLSKMVDGNIIRIAPTADIAKEEQEIARKKEAELQAGDLITKVYRLNYTSAKDAKKIIEDISKRTGTGGVSQRTAISIDDRTNTMLISDVEAMHQEYDRILKEIDRPTPQVMIDARIVEVNSDFVRQFGIQWGADVRLSPNARIGGLDLTAGEGFASGNPLLVNLPAAVGSGAGGAVGFGYIGAGALRALDLQLSAMESLREGKVISNPKIITTNNQKAEIKQGSKIPYQTVSAEGTQTQFVDATLSLVVTPTITPDNSVSMSVEVTKDEPGASTPAGPIIEKKEAKTNVLIRNTDTLVIGGIFKTNTRTTKNMVPLLGKIPVLGWLFKNKDRLENTTELLIFITPRIIEQPAEVMEGE